MRLKQGEVSKSGCGQCKAVAHFLLYLLYDSGKVYMLCSLSFLFCEAIEDSPLKLEGGEGLLARHLHTVGSKHRVNTSSCSLTSLTATGSD